MIREVTPADAAAVVELAVDSGLFPAGGAGVVEQLVSDYLARTRAEGHVCVLSTDEAGGLPLGVAYYEPRAGTDGTWELVMIAVRGAVQGRGHGAALLASVEEDLRARGQRLLLVQTSGVASFARTRAFYERLGYEPEARVRDYYEPGDDMIFYRKALVSPAQEAPALAR